MSFYIFLAVLELTTYARPGWLWTCDLPATVSQMLGVTGIYYYSWLKCDSLENKRFEEYRNMGILEIDFRIFFFLNKCLNSPTQEDTQSCPSWVASRSLVFFLVATAKVLVILLGQTCHFQTKNALLIFPQSEAAYKRACVQSWTTSRICVCFWASWQAMHGSYGALFP